MAFFLEILKAILIGTIEGITEWLPVSSTGHMIVVDELVHLNVSDEFLSLFLVVIQLGAIMAVVLLYFDTLNPFTLKKTAKEKAATMQLWQKVIVGCLPAAIIGVLFDDWVERRFYNALVVAVALIVYGVAFIIVERIQGTSGVSSRPRPPSRFNRDDGGIMSLTWNQVIAIGCFQCLAIIPGTSRSGATILGARLLGVSRQTAAEFSFFIAIPVMFGWSLLRVFKALFIDGLKVAAGEWFLLFIGITVAFIVSLLTIRFLIDYVKRNSFTAFGWYRIALGLIVIAYFAISGNLLG